MGDRGLILAGLAFAEGMALPSSRSTSAAAPTPSGCGATPGATAALYMFSDIPDDGDGDNGQCTEIELLLNAKVSKYVEVQSRLHSRFNQNYWTNFGGFGGRPEGTDPCIAGDCGEYGPLSNQYVKLRGMTVFIRPGYGWLDQVVLGSNDMGGWIRRSSGRHATSTVTTRPASSPAGRCSARR